MGDYRELEMDSEIREGVEAIVCVCVCMRRREEGRQR